jgi:peptidoglycan/xylan/chitin deacetylase (PgdA/CDA1 family)
MSFTFDDVPRSAAVTGGKVLSASGVRGTYYVSGSLCSSWEFGYQFVGVEEIVKLLDDGHEIGCHTYTHADVQRLDPARVSAELDANLKFLTSIDHRIRLSNFAYPYGSVGLFQKSGVSHRFDSCRGVKPGVNCGVADVSLLNAVPLYESLRKGRALRQWMELAYATNGWLVFYTHDVSDDPSEHGCSTSLLEQAVEFSGSMGFLRLTVEEALREIQFGAERQ